MTLSHELKQRVEEMLKQFPSTRDNTNELILKLWREDMQRLTGSLFIEFDEFDRLLKEGKLSHPETIRRLRQKIQEVRPELRGEKYYLRHQHQENVKAFIKEVA